MGDRVFVSLDILKADFERFARADNSETADYDTSDIDRDELRVYLDECNYGDM